MKFILLTFLLEHWILSFMFSVIWSLSYFNFLTASFSFIIIFADLVAKFIYWEFQTLTKFGYFVFWFVKIWLIIIDFEVTWSSKHLIIIFFSYSLLTKFFSFWLILFILSIVIIFIGLPKLFLAFSLWVISSFLAVWEPSKAIKFFFFIIMLFVNLVA